MLYNIRATTLCGFLVTLATLAHTNAAGNIGDIKQPLWYQPPSEKTLELAKIDDLSQTVVSDGEQGEKGVLASTLTITDDQAAKIKAGKFTVGIAMGSGTDVARESADIVLLGNDLVRFVATVAIARRTREIIWQNFVGTVAVDTLGIALAAVGLLSPLLAAFIHVTSEMAFILNSARLLPSREAAQKDPTTSRADLRLA